MSQQQSNRPSLDPRAGRPASMVVPPPPTSPPPRPAPVIRQRQRRRSPASAVLLAVLSGFLLFLLLACGLLAAYAAVASTLPAPETLSGRSAAFLSARLYDRNGQLLYEIDDPQGGRRILVQYDQISPYVINATVATEDSRFWQHPGVDPIGIVRAVIQNIRGGGIVSGASTIPQQLVRLVLLSPEERTAQTLSRKVREAVLAAEVSRRYSKQAILEIYLNEINYGNLAYGIEAAAETYFGKTAADLTLAEAAFLAGLPQAPAYWDPYSNPDGAKRRQAVVLDLMAEQGYITQAEAKAAKAQPLQLQPLHYDVEAPHFVIWIQQLLEQKYGTDVLYRSGLRVTTTLDLRLQSIAQQEVQAHLQTLQDERATDGALVALRPQTGEIVAMVGSADFNNADIAGQINMALRPRQPGSAIKPVTYVTAFEKGWTPATLIWDVTTQFPDGAGGTYVPQNYDGKEHGPVLVRQALAQSLNIPAVRTLDSVGLPAMLDTAHRLGIASLNRSDYGLSLTLGGGEVTALELTSAYAVFANGGRRVAPVAILRIEDAAGRVIEEYQPPAGEPVISPQHAYLITDILSDNEARAPVFGRNSALKLSRPAAAKTGTTNDYRDAWTVGYTPDLVAGVWVGNADNSKMSQVAGSRGAAPIWHNFMEKALAGQPATPFVRPEGIEEVEISADGGSLPSPACPPDRRRREIFAAGQGPLGPEHDLHQFVRIDVTTGARATEFCPANVVEERYFFVLPGLEGEKWAAEHNIPQPPAELCPVHTGAARVAILQPLAGDRVTEQVIVVGQATMPDFDYYSLSFGQGQEPEQWWLLTAPVYTPVDGGTLAVWDVRSLANGIYALRLAVVDRWGNVAETRTWVWVENPPPTWTPLPTWTPFPTLVPWPTETPWPTDTPTPPPEMPPTGTPWPTDTPTPPPEVPPTDTPTPPDTPTPTPETPPTDAPGGGTP